MLRYLRENTGNWIIKIFLGIIVIVFVFLGVGSFGSKRNDSVATINDEPITLKEHQHAHKALIDQMRARFGENLNEDILKALKQQALEALIEQKLLLAEADRLKIIVSEKELSDSLLSVQEFLLDGRFNMAQYKKVLGRNSLNPEIYEQLQIEALRQQKVRDLILNAVNISTLEAKNWCLFQQTKTSLDYVVIDPASYKDVKVTDEDIQKYYDENKIKYQSEEKVKAAYLKFSSEDHKEKAKVTDAHIKDYYEQYADEFKTPEKIEARHILIKVDQNAEDQDVDDALKKANQIYKKAVSGEDFEMLAKTYSEGPSKSTGGYLGTFEKAAMVKPFSDAAFSMKAGEISDPVRTMFGWHIIKVEQKIAAAITSLEKASETIRKKLENQERQNIAYYEAGDAFDAVIDGDDLDQVALITDKSISTTEAFSKTGESLNIEDPEGFAKVAFDLRVGTISDVVQFGQSFYIIKLVERKEPEIQPLNRVKDKVRKDLALNLQKKAAKADAEKFLSHAVKSNSILNVAKENDLQLQSTQLFTRNSQIDGIPNSFDVVKAGFTLDENHLVHPEIIETSSGYVIIQFKERQLPTEDQINDNISDVKNELNWRKQSQNYRAWISELKSKYKITYNTKLLN